MLQRRFRGPAWLKGKVYNLTDPEALGSNIAKSTRLFACVPLDKTARNPTLVPRNT